MIGQWVWCQSEDHIVIEPYALDSIQVDSSLLLQSFIIKPKTKWGFSLSSNNEYEVFLSRAIDSMLVKGGNVLKVLECTTDDFNHSYNSRSLVEMKVEIYQLDENEYYDLYLQHEEIKNKHEKRYEDLSWIRKKTVTKYDDGWYAENRFKSWYSIPRDSTTGKYLELGVSAGSDILFALNMHFNTELYLLNKPYVKVSLSNKVGFMWVALAEYAITYDAPGIKLAVPIKNVWLTATYGKEFLRYHVPQEGLSVPKKDVIDKRLDIGLKFYKSKTKSIEVYYPLRLDDDVIPWWTGGIVMSMNYRL